MNDNFLMGFSFVLVAIALGISTVAFNIEHNAFVDSQQAALFYKQRYEYYSQGAIDRRYLDLCKNANDEVGLWYKDDCVK